MEVKRENFEAVKGILEDPRIQLVLRNKDDFKSACISGNLEKVKEFLKDTQIKESLFWLPYLVMQK